MMENTNQTNFEDLFVDTADNIAEKVTDSNDFYDDTDFIDTVNEVDSNSIFQSADSLDMNVEEFDEEPISKLSFNIDDETINESSIFQEIKEEPVEFEDVMLEQPFIEELEEITNDEIVELSPLQTFDEIEELKEESEIISEDFDEIEQIKEEPENVSEEFNEIEPVEKEVNNDESFDPFNISSLTNDDMDKMIEEDNKKQELDDSYVLSNFDVLFDSLYNDVNGANNFISNLIEQKKNVNTNEATLKEEEEKLLKEKEEFAKYMQVQKESIEAEKEQCKEFVKTQKNRLQNEEEKFNNDMEAAKEERKLAEEALKIEQQKLADEKEQFEKYKEVEEAKLKSEREKIETERQQFDKEKEIELEKIKNDKKELQTQKDQFAKTKELEEKKLELESKNLSQSCARFKELVSQFNSGFQQLPEDK